MSGRIVAAFCLSGASSLIFEMVWMYRASLVLGSTVWSTSLVLSSFMGGLAIGSALAGRFGARSARPLRLYAAVELIVAVSGIGLTYLLGGLSPFLAPLTASFLDTPWLVNLLRLGVTFALLLVPATAMGATLPLVTAAVAQSRRAFGSRLGALYGANTLGAVAGVLVVEFVLMARWGVIGSAWSAGALSCGAAVLALWSAPRETPGVRPALPNVPSLTDTSGHHQATEAAWPRSARGLACAALMGATLMALEVVWFRFLSLFTVASTQAASLMLAVVLGAIATGGLLASTWLTRPRDTDRAFVVIACAATCTTVLSYATFALLTTNIWAAEWYRIVWAAVVLTAPTSVLSGAAFVVLGAAMQSRSGESETRTIGRLATANTVGGLAGPLIAAFILLPTIGLERSLAVLAIGHASVAALVGWTFAGYRVLFRSRLTVAAAFAAIAAIVLFPFGLMERDYFARATREYVADGSTLAMTREGAAETIHLLAKTWLGRSLYFRLVTNGFSMSGTHTSGKRYMRDFAYLPMLLREQPIRRALVICYGAGVTAEAVTSIESVGTIDIAEISPDIVAMSPRIYDDSEDPLRDPRVRLHIEDGRYFLQATPDRFDLITAEPPPPLTPGTVSLYTKEFFQLVHDRLSDGGVASYWLPVARRGEYDVKAIIAAFCDVFDDCSMWNGTPYDWMLVGTRGAPGPVSEATFAAHWAEPRLLPKLREMGFEEPQLVGATFLGDRDDLRRLAADTAPLVDDYPQRLRPAPGRLALTRGSATADMAAAGFVDAVIDTRTTQAAFERSPFIRAHWPPRLVNETLPLFAVQRTLNEVMRDGPRPLDRIEDIHDLLTRTTLRRPPLWLLGSDDAQQEAADVESDTSGMSHYVVGVRALVARQFEVAAAAFAEAERRGLRLEPLRPLRAYALCLSGRMDLARELLPTMSTAAIASLRRDEQHFWNWLQKTFFELPASSQAR